MSVVHHGRPVTNRILQALSEQAWQALEPHLQRIDLPHRRVLYQPGDRIESVYFVEAGFVSLVKTMADGRAVEIGGVGIEGLVGISSVYGYDRSLFECVVQVAGAALQIGLRDLHRVMDHSPTFNRLLIRYSYIAVNQIVQTAACNRLHSLEERCCRWLLVAHDGINDDEIPLTHEFLAVMLGVQRPGVSVALSALQQDGLIRQGRGRVTIMDRRSLERRACECYRTIHDEIERVFSPPD
jgi:CRP-like cAMP-binding protein